MGEGYTWPGRPAGAVGGVLARVTLLRLPVLLTGMLCAAALGLFAGAAAGVEDTIVVETELRHDDRLVAKVIQTQAVLRPRGE